MKRTLLIISSAFLLACASYPAEAPKPAEPVKVQCAGITKTGNQCKRKVSAPAVFCWQHIPKCTTDLDCEQKTKTPTKGNTK
jgi:hypothetical protein